MKFHNTLISSTILVIVVLLTTALRPLAPQAPLGATINVNIFIDEYNDTHTGCSLREAIESANSNSDIGGCSHSGTYGNDIILLGTDMYRATRYNDTFPISEDNNVYGDLDIRPDTTSTGTGEYDLTIQGSSPLNTITTAINTDRVFDIQANVKVKLVDLKIINGQPAETDGKNGNGAGIFNHGTLFMDGCSVELNSNRTNSSPITMDIGDGGGIWTDGTLTVVDSTISNNQASPANNSPNSGGDGGAIYIDAASSTVLIATTEIYSNTAGNVTGTSTGSGGRGGGIFNAGEDTTIDRSTIYSNTAGAASTAAGDGGDGGGIYNYQGTLTITNTTLFNNHSGNSEHAKSGNGGGLVNYRGTAAIDGSTIYQNQTGTGISYGTGGGIESFAIETTTQLHNTILADNRNTGPVEEEQIPDCHSTGVFTNIFDASFSLISDMNGCVLNLDNKNLKGSQPTFGSFNYHGGPTPFFPLLGSSLGIDDGDSKECLATDQRGWYRPADGDHNGTAICDIGAHEFPLLGFLPLMKK